MDNNGGGMIMNKLKRWFRRVTIALPVIFLISMCFLVNYQIKRAYADDPVIDWEVTPRGNYKGMYIAPDPAATFPISGTITATIEGGSTEATQLLVKQLLQDLKDGKATETTVAALLVQLQKQKFTGDNLKVVFSNSTIGATQSGTWNIGTLTGITNPVTVTATDLDIRTLSKNSDSVETWQPDPSKLKVLMYGNTNKDGTGVLYVPLVDNAGHLQIDALTLPAITATDLDIRDLSSATDSVSIEGGNTTAVKVDGSGVTQPISAASLPLPTGASLDATLTNATQKTQVVDGSGNVIGATSNALDINIKSGNPTSISSNAGTGWADSGIAKEAGGNLADIKTAVENIEARLDDDTRSETDEWERFEVQGYSEVTKTYTNVNKISVAVETADKTIRVSANNYDTTTDYAVIRSDALGWTNGDLRYPSYTIKLKGDTETDTANVCVIVEKYVE
jgi:hypothetical protein